MVPFNVVFAVVVSLTVLSGFAATVLVVARPTSVAARKVAERLGQIALLGATTVFALLVG